MRNIRSIDGKDIQWIPMEKKQIGIVQPILSSMKNENESEWNYSELEKLQKRCSELIEQNPPKKGHSHEYVDPHLIRRFESLYASMACQVFICPCSIRFYQITDLDICSFQQWKYLYSGYPMWIFNHGSNPRRRKELRLAIIDQQTGFTLWSDLMIKQSNFVSTNQTILSFRHSTFNSFQMIRFQSAETKMFDDFLSFYREKQSCLFAEQASTRTSWQKRRITKSEISLPRDFHHWNHLQRFSFDSFIFQRRRSHFSDEKISNMK